MIIVLVILYSNVNLVSQNSSDVRYDGTIGIITIGFDHDYASQGLAINNMTRYGYHGDLYTIVKDLNEPQYLNATYLLYLQDHGWNIISHSWTHQQINDTTPYRIVYNETVLSKFALQKFGFKITGYVPPRIEFTTTSKEMISHNYNYTIMFTSGSNDLDSLKKRILPNVISLYAESVGVGPGPAIQSFADAKSFIDYQIDHKTWGILHFHNFTNGPKGYDCDPKLFYKILQYLNEKEKLGKLKITTSNSALGFN